VALEVSAAASIRQTALLSHPTPLLTPTAPPQGTGPPSHPPTESPQAHGALAHQQVVGKPSSPADLASAPEAAAGEQVAAAHSVVPVLEDGDSLVHGLPVARGLLGHGLAGGTRTRAPSLTGPAGPAVPGALLPRGRRGLAAAHPLLLLALTQLHPTVSHTPPLASDTSSRRTLVRVPALHLH